jgi:hypothetical protein
VKEMVQKIIKHAGTGALISAQAFEKAAAELGYGKEEIVAAMQDFDGFPLDDDDLLDVVGGVGLENGYMNQTHGYSNRIIQNQTISFINISIG